MHLPHFWSFDEHMSEGTIGNNGIQCRHVCVFIIFIFSEHHRNSSPQFKVGGPKRTSFILGVKISLRKLLQYTTRIGPLVPNAQRFVLRALQYAAQRLQVWPGSARFAIEWNAGNYVVYTSSTPRLHFVYTSSRPILHLVYTSPTPRLHLVYTSSTPRLHLAYTSSTPRLHLVYTSSTPRLHLV